MESQPEIPALGGPETEQLTCSETIESELEPKLVSKHKSSEELLHLSEPNDPPAVQTEDISQAIEQLSITDVDSYLTNEDSFHVPTCSKTYKKRFSRLFTPIASEPECDDMKNFKPSTKLTPFFVSNGAYQVLKSKIGLENYEVSWAYSILSHGDFSHTWSLVPTVGMNIVNPSENTTPIHPIAELKTMGPGINYGEAHISDLQFRWEATSITMVHYYDSYSLNGTHTGYRVEEGSFFEWTIGKSPDVSGIMPLLLWKETTTKPPTRHLVAKLTTEPFFTSPCGNSKLWCLEIDEDHADSHVAMLSAFAMKECHSKLASLFAKKTLCLPPALPLLNYAFQDDGRVLGRSGKFWGDWEDELQATRSSTEPGVENHEDVKIIKVFTPSHLRKFALNHQVVKRLNEEIMHKVEDIKLYYSIR